VTLGRPDNVYDNAASPLSAASPAPAAAQELPKGPGSNALSRGHMAAFVFRKEPEALPEIKFQDAEGKERTLADWHGKVILLNLWATWCLPCRKEMPSLDRLQKALGSDKFEVLALSVDRKGLEASKKFLDETKVERLGLYVDASTRATSALRVVGLPATLLIDTQGREIGRLLGPAEWDSEDAQHLIRTVLQ
jgi:thiol-disulfide isomerase/thioredoxin